MDKTTNKKPKTIHFKVKRKQVPVEKLPDFRLASVDLELYNERTASKYLKALDDKNEEKKQQQQQQQNAFNSMDQDLDDRYAKYTKDVPVPKPSKLSRKVESSNQIWNSSSSIKQWFLESSSYGKPDPTLKAPHTIKSTNCSCQKKVADITVYMLYNSCKVKVEHCNCRSLVHALILMHVFPSTDKRPSRGCHFAMLDNLHLQRTLHEKTLTKYLRFNK